MALRVNPRLGGFARDMRRAPTPIEDRLWRELRASRLAGLKFRRQSVIDPYIVDFLCPGIGLVVEVDGDTHEPDRDGKRDQALARQGFTVIRFANVEVGANLPGVLDAIVKAASRLPPRFTHPPAPSLEREGEG